jgi:copper chaperone CopZ
MNGRFWTFLAAIILSCTSFLPAKAQFTEVEIGVNGLTCSQCTRSVEMRIRKLDFVDQVQMDLEKTSGTVIFKKNRKVDIEQIAQAVKDAGFSVRYLKAYFTFDESDAPAGTCFRYKGDKYIFVQPPQMLLKGNIPLTFVGSAFMTQRELKKWNVHVKDNCGMAPGNTYFVTL